MKQFIDAQEVDVRDGRVDYSFDVDIKMTTNKPTTTTILPTKPTTEPPVVILVDDQPAPTNATVPAKTGKKGKRGKKRPPRSPRRARPTRKRFRGR